MIYILAGDFRAILAKTNNIDYVPLLRFNKYKNSTILLVNSMLYIKSSEHDWQDKKGYSKKVLLTEDALDRQGIHVQNIKIKAGDIAENHYHKKQTEIFYFLNRNGYFDVNGHVIRPDIGDVIVIQPMDKHKVVNDTDRDFLYIAFKFDYQSDDLIWEKE